jgi:transketolase
VSGSSPQQPDLVLSSGPWTPDDADAVVAARLLAADAVEQAGNGHPGTAMSLAPVAHLLFQRYLTHDPADPTWIGRDRFVLSCGHSSLTLYIQLFLTGYGLELDDLKQFRTWGSLTPGHPEFGHTRGVETTTGPLGQGVANAVGMAMAARREAGLLDPEAAPGDSVFDHRVFVLASDGDLQEGVSAEASSFAGRQALGNLVLIYDSNRISIEGDTDLAFTEDVAARYAAYGWHVQQVDLAADGDIDLAALAASLDAAVAESGRPSLIVLRSVIAWPAPHAQGTSASHGAKLGAAEVAATKVALGADPELSFAIDQALLDRTRAAVATRAASAKQAWDLRFSDWAKRRPEEAALLERLRSGQLPQGWVDQLPTFEGVTAMATRKASGAVINALAEQLPELWGGSADLGESNNTDITGARSFLPAPDGDPGGRQLHFGIREHAMGSMMNGVALHGRSRIFGGTFLVFSDYMRPAVRMAALMGLPVTYVWTHDSIGLGEDGPTHQPVEHLAALRAIPGLDVIRPADATETAAAWAEVMRRNDRPAGLVLTRQDVPVIDRSSGPAATEVARGGYVLQEASTPSPDVVLIATGSEVSLAVAAREVLESEGIGVRVVSMPCVEWFRDQSPEYRTSVLPPAVRARVSVEAAITWPWAEFVGDAGHSIGLDHFGASADYKRLYREFGITVESVVAAAKASHAAASA